MVDFAVPDEIRDISEGLNTFIEREILPLEEANKALFASERNLYDAAGRYTEKHAELRKQSRMKSAAGGFYTMFGAKELGGSGLGPQALVYIHDRMNTRFGMRPLVHKVVIPSEFTNALTPVLTFLKPELREQYLPGIASGEKTLCVGISEPDAGSDVYNMRTKAVRDGKDWVLNGTKQWITNAPYADYCLLFAVTDPERSRQRKGGITGFFIDAASQGYDASNVIPVMGHLGGDTGIITLDEVRVPDSHVLGEVDDGMKVALTGINTGRIAMASICAGLAQWGLNQAIDYAKVRKTFGKPIAEHQMVQGMLAEMAMDIYASKNMLRHCAWKIEQGEKSVKEISMVKAHATEMLCRVMDTAIEVHGGIGLTNELGLNVIYRWARTMRIPDGTSEIQRRNIARRLLEGDTEI